MELALRAVSAIVEKLPFVISPHFLLFDTSKPVFFLMFLLRNIKAYLCPNMIKLDGVDFKECRSL